MSANGYYAQLAARDLGLPLIVTAQGERKMDATGALPAVSFPEHHTSNASLWGGYRDRLLI